MNRKIDFSTLLLFTAFLFGIIIRFYPALTNGFPLNDGGMFYTMVQDLKANGYALPQFTTYNDSDIPFAYPPLGFYIASFFGLLLNSDLTVFLYLPALINTLSILAFYFFAKEILDSRIKSSLATIIYALSARAFLWQIMGGGITRAFGILFLLLMLWQAIKLFRNYQQKNLILTILFGALTIMSHPQTALHAALGGLFIFLFYGLNKRGILSAILVGIGVALVSSPWWLTILSTHGISPFLSAGQSSSRTIEFYLIVLRLHTPLNIVAIPFLILFYIGLWISMKNKNFFFIAWIVIAYLLDPRGADGIALLPEAMLASIGLIQIISWINRKQELTIENQLLQRKSLNVILLLIIWFLLAASVSDFQLVNTSLKTDDLDMIEWVNENIEKNKTFLLATGREFSMTDPFQEWFPALTNQYSRTTMQGLEWTLSSNFFPYYEELTMFQKCTDVNCVNEWVAKNNVEYDYLIILIPSDDDVSELANSLRSLGISVRNSALHMLIYESEHAMVFEYSK